MISEQELTRGQKIDKGDEILGAIDEDRRAIKQFYLEMVDRVKEVVGVEAHKLEELGCFPLVDTLLGDDVSTEEKASLLIIEPFLIDNSREVLILTPNGELLEGDYVSEHLSDNVRRQYHIDRGSLVEVEPLYFMMKVGQVFSVITSTIREAQEEWFGPRMSEVNSDKSQS